jgi:hypothetical protein
VGRRIERLTRVSKRGEENENTCRLKKYKRSCQETEKGRRGTKEEEKRKRGVQQWMHRGKRWTSSDDHLAPVVLISNGRFSSRQDVGERIGLMKESVRNHYDYTTIKWSAANDLETRPRGEIVLTENI